MTAVRNLAELLGTRSCHAYQRGAARFVALAFAALSPVYLLAGQVSTPT